MIKIWIKTIEDNKVKRSKTMKILETYSRENLEYAIRNCLAAMDIPAPVFLDCHFGNFEKFKTAKFLPRDFVETVDFDRLEVTDIDQ